MSEEVPFEQYHLPEGEMRSILFPEIDRLIDERSEPLEVVKRERHVHYANDTADCVRAQFYKWMYYPETDPVSDEVTAKGEAGRICEAWVKDRVKRAGLWRGDEVRVGTEQPAASYRIDIVMDYPALKYYFDKYKGKLNLRPLPDAVPEMQVIPCEIKSQSNYPFGKVKTKPKWAHYCQTQLYIHSLNAPYGFLIYVNRDNFQRASHIVWKDEALIKLLLLRQVVMDGFLTRKEMPPREGVIKFGPRGGMDPDDFCSICHFRSYCWFDEIMERANLDHRNEAILAVGKIPRENMTENMKRIIPSKEVTNLEATGRVCEQ